MLLCPLLSLAQITYRGTLAEAGTSKPVAYASVALKKKNTGVNANEQGAFSFTCPEGWTDTVIISCVGYRSLLLPLNEWKDNAQILLERNERILRPVVVKTNWKYQDIGNFTVKPDHFFTSLGNQYQVARRFSAPVAEAWLDKVIIAVGKRGGSTMFRVRVYDLDRVTGGPGQELTDSVITVTSRGKTETVDILPYLVYLPQQEFFVSVEWIQTPGNLHLLKAKVKGGTEMERMYYKPFICLTKNDTPRPNEIWGLFYSGKWEPIYATGEDGLGIAAKVRY